MFMGLLHTPLANLLEILVISIINSPKTWKVNNYLLVKENKNITSLV